jgi:hypothetical protein
MEAAEAKNSTLVLLAMMVVAAQSTDTVVTQTTFAARVANLSLESAIVVATHLRLVSLAGSLLLRFQLPKQHQLGPEAQC